MGHLYSIINSVCTVRGQIPANVPSIISHGNWYLSWISCESAKALLEQQDPLQKKRTTLRPNKFKFGITDCRRAWFVKTAQLLLSFWTSLMCLSSVQFSHSVMSDSLRCHGLQQTRPPCPSPTPRVYPNSCPLSWWCHPTISSSVIPFSSHLQSFPASESFQMSQSFTGWLAKVLEFQLQHQSFQWTPRTDLL